MARDERLIAESGALADGGTGARFPRSPLGGDETGFAVRYRGAVCAFVNRCPHLGTELDWRPGEFFDVAGLYLVCSTHGAIFEPRTGYCVAGPCRGASLERLQVREEGGRIYLIDDAPAPTTDE
jgi:nitrite reductase/ring-hydroxylating ferredoxin subunit